MALFCLLGGFPQGGAAAQSVDGGVLRGYVTDASGLPVSGAQVRVRAPGAETAATGAGNTAARNEPAWSDRRGAFMLLGVSAGEYPVEVRLPRGRDWCGGARLRVEAGEIMEVVLRLRSGQEGPEVQVWPGPEGTEGADGRAEGREGALAGGAAQVRPGAPETPDLSELPLRDRQWESAAELGADGVDATRADRGAVSEASEAQESAAARADGQSGTAAGGLSYAGLPVTQNTQTVDGLSADESFGGGPRGETGGAVRLGSSFAQSAVAEVRVRPRTFSAESGGAGGSVVVRSRAAEPRLRGSAFVEARQSAWAATNPFAGVTRYTEGAVSGGVTKPNDAELQFGGAAGLPLGFNYGRRWHAGVFAALEGQMRAQTVVSTPEDAGFFALTATQRALLANRGVGTAAVDAALAYLDSLMGSKVEHTPRTLGFVRVDGAPHGDDRLSVSAQVQRQSAPVLGGEIAEGVTDRALDSIGTSELRVEAYAGQWAHAFGRRAVNALRVQDAQEERYETPAPPSAMEPGVGPGGYAPQVAIEPEGFRYGTPATLGRVAYPDESRVEVADRLALRLGQHVLKGGGDWSRVHDRVLSATNLEGAFLYDSGTTGGRAGGLVDWITDYTFNVHAYPNGGCPSIHAAVHDFCYRSYAQSFTGDPVAFVTHQIAGFAEDSVRLRQNLTLSAGLRYEYLLLPFPQRPNAVMDSVLEMIGSPTAGTTARFPEDRNNAGPRISAAWSPGRAAGARWFTVEAGYGVFFGRLPGATLDAALAETDLPGSTTGIRIVPTTETACPQVAASGVSQGFGYPCSFLTVPAGVAGQTASAMVFARRFRLPAVQRAALSLERGLGRRVFFRAAFATAWAAQLPQSVDLNIAPGSGTATYVIEGGGGRPGLRTGETFAVPLYTSRRSALFGPVTALESNANATYESGTAELQVRDWHRFRLKASYTFSRAIDYGPQTSAAPRQDGQFDPFTDGYDKGLSSFQIPHRVTGSAGYRSELREGPAVVRTAFSDWRLAAIGTVSSGAPYSYGIFGGTRLPGGHESINGSGGATYLPTVGRNTLRLPQRSRLDVRVGREMALGRRMRLELRADAFNVLNTISVSRVETRAFLVGAAGSVGGMTPLVFQDGATITAEGLTTPAFGTPLSSTSGLSRERQVALGGRLSF